MSKPAKPAAKEEASADAAPKKNKKKLFILIGIAVLVLGGGGAAAFLMMKKPAKAAAAHTTEDTAKDDHADDEEEDSAPADDKHPPKFVDLGSFVTNLANEDGEHVVQVVVSVKIKKPELEEKIKGRTPEIAHYINMVLQSKRPSDIANLEGKQELADQIKAQIEYVLGFRKKAPPITMSNTEHNSPTGQKGDDQHSKKTVKKIKSDIAEVLFTSFIVQ